MTANNPVNNIFDIDDLQLEEQYVNRINLFKVRRVYKTILNVNEMAYTINPHSTT